MMVNNIYDTKKKKHEIYNNMGIVFILSTKALVLLTYFILLLVNYVLVFTYIIMWNDNKQIIIYT